MAGRIDERLRALGIELPQAAPAVAAYVPYTISGTTLYVSGQITVWNGERRFIGKVGRDLTVEEGVQAARLCGLNILAQARAACGGDLDRVARCLKLGGFVNCGPDFTDHPAVINGASELMTQVLGDAGKHARIAVGAASLPLGVAVEVDAVFELS
ncbi:RidA family protein [Azospirillum halopraeferens]|uniref:RidA family protein n=1 Tax=Azospirillum halopraeferens TaxID=34010 RepID=UPI00040576CB|nr:RidA family protein [Azospirillum halopraeferens]